MTEMTGTQPNAFGVTADAVEQYANQLRIDAQASADDGVAVGLLRAADGLGDLIAAADDQSMRAILAAIDNALRNGSYMTGANLAFGMLCDRLGIDRDRLEFRPDWAAALRDDRAAHVDRPRTIADSKPFRWDPGDNCYCGGPEEISPHRHGTGRHCGRKEATR